MKPQPDPTWRDVTGLSVPAAIVESAADVAGMTLADLLRAAAEKMWRGDPVAIIDVDLIDFDRLAAAVRREAGLP